MKLFLLLICSMSQLTLAYTPKEGNISAILSPFVFKTDFRNSDSGAQSSHENGMNLTAIGDINDHGSLELALFYMKKPYFFHDDDQFLAQKTQVIHVTMGYRHWINSYLSTSLSIFSTYPTGDVQTLHSDFTAANFPETAVAAKTIYGLELAVQYEIWSHGLYAITADTRYSKAMTLRSSERGDHYGIMLGLRYFIQEKTVINAPAP